MSDQNQSGAEETSGPLPTVRIETPVRKPDFATIIGLTGAIGVIILAIVTSNSDANFFNVPSLLIVLIGTMLATSTSFSGTELKNSVHVILKTMMRKVQSPNSLAKSLVDLAVIAKKKGILALSNYESELKKDEFLYSSMQLVVDGYQPVQIERLLTNELDATVERHKRTASFTKRASEIAPAMGLIGTLVGLVQMLAELENPEAIGPAMAVALLTTFYGAILGTVVMAPLGAKLEKNSYDEVLIKTLTLTAASSIARQDNPRQLEMLLNSELPPSQQIRYFD